VSSCFEALKLIYYCYYLVLKSKRLPHSVVQVLINNYIAACLRYIAIISIMGILFLSSD